MKKWLAALTLFSLLLLPEISFAASAHETALEQTKVCAFSAEYDDDGANVVRRWEMPIKVYLSGGYTESDLTFFHQFLYELGAKVPDMPPVSIVNRAEDANVQMYFVKLQDISLFFDHYVPGNWGFFHFDYSEDNIINKGTIGVSIDTCDQTARNHIIMEEFVGMLGLANDHMIDDKSILYQGWTTVQELTEADWNMIRMLYHPMIWPGLTWKEAEPIMNMIF